MSSPKKVPDSEEHTPSGDDKLAFVQAMYRGLEPDSEAARTVNRKMAPGSSADTSPVEIVRHIPARGDAGAGQAAEAPLEGASARAIELADAINAMLDADAPDGLDPRASQALLGALIRHYAVQDERGERGTRAEALGPNVKVTATDVLVMCGALLEAVDLQVFELAVFQSWSSR